VVPLRPLEGTAFLRRLAQGALDCRTSVSLNERLPELEKRRFGLETGGRFRGAMEIWHRTWIEQAAAWT